MGKMFDTLRAMDEYQNLKAFHVDILYVDVASGERLNDGEIVYAKTAKQAAKLALRYYRKEDDAQVENVEEME